jgi:hypothetical protein
VRIISTRESGVFDNDDQWCEGYEIFLSFTKEEMDSLLAAYDPLSGTSPSVADARPVLRAILDKILEEA